VGQASSPVSAKARGLWEDRRGRLSYNCVTINYLESYPEPVADASGRRPYPE